MAKISAKMVFLCQVAKFWLDKKIIVDFWVTHSSKVHQHDSCVKALFSRTSWANICIGMISSINGELCPIMRLQIMSTEERKKEQNEFIIDSIHWIICEFVTHAIPIKLSFVNSANFAQRSAISARNWRSASRKMARCSLPKKIKWKNGVMKKMSSLYRATHFVKKNFLINRMASLWRFSTSDKS